MPCFDVECTQSRGEDGHAVVGRRLAAHLGAHMTLLTTPNSRGVQTQLLKHARYELSESVLLSVVLPMIYAGVWGWRVGRPGNCQTWFS